MLQCSSRSGFFRFLLSAALVAAASLMLSVAAAPARAQSGAGESEAEVWVESCDEVAGVCVHASEFRSLRPVATPDRRRGPPTVVCVWYRYGNQPGGWDDPDGTVALSHLWIGGLYVLDCHRVADGSRVVGYPRVVVHAGRPGIPGDAVSGWEVAEYARNLLQLDPPQPAISPPNRQIVGIETWFAVRSRLRGHEPRSAQAGSTWATVRATFAEATWDLGPYGELVCRADADRVWDRTLPGSRQASRCTRVFERASGPGLLRATVAVRWRIHWSSSEHAGWLYHGDELRTAAVYLDVDQMQAVIR